MKQVLGGVHLQTANLGEMANCWCNLPYPPGPIVRPKVAGTHRRVIDRLLFAQRGKLIFRIFLLLVGILSLNKIVIFMRQQLDLLVQPLKECLQANRKPFQKPGISTEYLNPLKLNMLCTKATTCPTSQSKFVNLKTTGAT